MDVTPNENGNDNDENDIEIDIENDGNFLKNEKSASQISEKTMKQFSVEIINKINHMNTKFLQFNSFNASQSTIQEEYELFCRMYNYNEKFVSKYRNNFSQLDETVQIFLSEKQAIVKKLIFEFQNLWNGLKIINDLSKVQLLYDLAIEVIINVLDFDFYRFCCVIKNSPTVKFGFSQNVMVSSTHEHEKLKQFNFVDSTFDDVIVVLNKKNGDKNIDC